MDVKAATVWAAGQRITIETVQLHIQQLEGGWSKCGFLWTHHKIAVLLAPFLYGAL
jgi:hypothetical protein